jgi:hypothetical protein
MARPRLCAALLFVLPLALRLALLSRNPIPVPSGADDFGYLLLADTLRHFRLANPPLYQREFFEQLFVLQQPAFAPIFPLGNGLLLAVGTAAGCPWIGVLLGASLFTVACYWMLRGWTSPHWAFLGATLVAIQFGPLCYWMNCYWGGYTSAIAGCLCFGALPRRKFFLLGIGLALQLLTRPYEFLLLAIGLMLLSARSLNWQTALPLMPAVLLIAFQNQAVTGSWKTLPYTQYRYEYGTPATFTFQTNAVPHRELNQEQELDYKIETATHDSAPDYFSRLVYRIRFARFFLSPALLIAFCCGLRRSFRVSLPILVMVLGSTFYPYFYPHYVAAISCLVMLVVVRGLSWLSRGGALAIALTCFGQLLFGMLWTQGGWEWINPRDPQGRATVAATLSRDTHRKLVFVHYSPVHGFAEWVHNDADVTSSSIIWAHDLGSTEDQKLSSKYPDRELWILFPDENPPRLQRYRQPSSPFEQVQ